jgi:hypothetical protein
MKYLTVCTAALLAIGLAVSITPASAGDYQGGRRDHGFRDDCYKCPKPRPNYDSTEVIKDSKEVDHSRVIETQSVVPSKRLIETNHLVIHENEVRNIGTVQHNHTIIEKELVLTKRNVDHKYVNNEVNLVEHKYNTERKRIVEERELPGEERHLRCECPRDKGPLRAYGMATDSAPVKAAPARGYGTAPKYVSSRY